MNWGFQEFEEFYQSDYGRLIAKALKAPVRNFFQHNDDQLILSCGYSPDFDIESFQICSSILPARKAGRAAQSLMSLQPFANAAIDKIVMMHAIETHDNPNDVISEIWRMLKPDGEALVILPNKAMPWMECRSLPSALSWPKMQNLLCANRFEIIDHQEILYTPHQKLCVIAAPVFEFLGPYIPIDPAFHMITLRKKLYGPIFKDDGQKTRLRDRILKTAPARPSSRVKD